MYFKRDTYISFSNITDLILSAMINNKNEFVFYAFLKFGIIFSDSILSFLYERDANMESYFPKECYNNHLSIKLESKFKSQKQ